MRILVTGASGYIGSRLVAALLTDGHVVTASSRNARTLNRFGWSDRAATVDLDTSDSQSLSAAFEATGPIDVAYYLVHGIGEAEYRETDRAAASAFAAAAQSAGVGRVVYLGGFVPATEGLSEHLRSRAEVGEALRDSGGPELVWLRAAMVLGAGSASFEMMRYLADRLLVIPMPEWVDHRMDPISVRDAIHYLVAAADPDRLPAGDYDISGPEPSTYRNVLFAYLRALRQPRLALTLPAVDTRLAGWFGSRLMPVPTGLAGDLVQSLDYPMGATEHGIRELVPDPVGGLVDVRTAIEKAISSPYPVPVDALADPHHLADTDPSWSGGDWIRAQRFARRQLRTVTAPIRALDNWLRP